MKNHQTAPFASHSLQKTAVIGFSSLLMALVAMPEVRAAAQMHGGLIAQTTEQEAEPTKPFPLPQSVEEGTVIQVDGSASLQATVADLQQRFEGRFAGTAVDILQASDGQALERLRQGEVELVAIGRALTAEEEAEGLVAVPMEREKLAVFTHTENPFEGELTFDQFVQIFRGEIQDWEELGGSGEGRIRFIDRPETSDTRRSLGVYDIFGGNLETGETAEVVDEDSTAAVIAALGEDGIGYGVYSQLRDNPDVRIIPMHGVMPFDPAYPYSQPRNLVYNPNTLSEGGAAFLGLVTAVAEQEAVEGIAAVAMEPGAAIALPATDTPPATEAPTGVVPTPEGDRPVPLPDTELGTESGTTAEAVEVPIAGDEDGFPWWLLILPLLLGAGLWALVRSNGRGMGVNNGSGSGMAALTGVPGAIAAEPRIILTPRNCRRAYVYWEIANAHKRQMQRQGGNQMTVRIYDVTGIAIDRTPPHTVRQFRCHERDQDLHVPIEMDNRDYVAEVGYTTPSGQWLCLARSPQVRVPACAPGEGDVLSEAAPAAVGAALAGAGGVPATTGTGSTRMATTPAIASTQVLAVRAEPRVVLTARRADLGYAYWELPEQRCQELHAQNNILKVRLHDVTQIDITQTDPHQTTEYVCPPDAADLFLPIEQLGRDYLVDLGYSTPENDWVWLARSPHIHFPEPDAGLSKADLEDGFLTTGRRLPTVGALTGAALAGAALTGATSPPPADVAEAHAPNGAEGSTDFLQLHRRNHSFLLDPSHLETLQQVAATQNLTPGLYKIFIKEGGFDYRALAGHPGEPWVLLWLSGGRVINQKTRVPVSSTWSTLNGYGDSLVLEVLEPTTLNAFFVDTYVEDNEGEMIVSIERLPS